MLENKPKTTHFFIPDNSVIPNEVLLDETGVDSLNSSEILVGSEVNTSYNTSSADNSVNSIILESLSTPPSPNAAMTFVENLLSSARMLQQQCISLHEDEVDGKMAELRQYLQILAQSISPPIACKTTQTDSTQTAFKCLQTDDLQRTQTTSIDTQTNSFPGKNVSTQCKVVASSKKVQTMNQYSSTNTQTDGFPGKNIATQYKVPGYAKKVQTLKERPAKKVSMETQTDPAPKPIEKEAPSTNTEIVNKIESILTSDTNGTATTIVDYSDSEESETLSAIYQAVYRNLRSEEIKVTPDIESMSNIVGNRNSVSDDDLSEAENYFKKSRRTRLVLGDQPATATDVERKETDLEESGSEEGISFNNLEILLTYYS